MPGWASGRYPCQISLVYSGSSMRSSSRLPWLSNRQSSTLVACAENSAKFTPSPSQVAPRGKGWPSAIRERCWAVRPWLLPLLAFMVDYSWAESASDFGSLILVVSVTGGLRVLVLLRAAGLPSSSGFSSCVSSAGTVPALLRGLRGAAFFFVAGCSSP